MNNHIGRPKRKTTDNKGFAIAGVQCFADTLVQGGSLVLLMNICAKNPPLRQAEKRYVVY